jgi:sensor histidine kinase YesM
MLVWLPVFMMYSYPLMYWVVPKFLLKGKYFLFITVVLMWGVLGWFINIYFRLYIFIPIQEAMHYEKIIRGGPVPGSYLCLTTTAAGAVIITVFKHWILKQRQWLKAEKEKITAELQLLKAQVHPHFLFNTLNNIYSFSLENSPKTPGMILKLSSLLSYMLYECGTEEVLLEKEIGIMKNYVDLEKERYGNKIEISWSAEGDIKDKYIAPLLMLPFLENAFKHGTSEQVEKPWLSVDISVKYDTLRCKIANSKNEYVPYSNSGIGIQNVKKRLAFIYPDKYELKLSDEGNFFVVSLLIKLDNYKKEYLSALTVSPAVGQIA